MNPAFIFKFKSEAFIVRVTQASLAGYLNAPEDLRVLLRKIETHIGYDTEQREHQYLPIGDELQGKWVCNSPMGQEYQNPPIKWEFKERVKNALTSEIHSFAIFPQVSSNDQALTSKKAKAEAKAVMEAVLGSGTVVEVQTQQVRTALDDALDWLC